MGKLLNLFSPRIEVEERAASDLENPSIDLLEALGSYDHLSMPTGNIFHNYGVATSPESALGFAAVYSCVKVLAETIGSLPFHLYEKTNHGRIQSDDPRSRILNEEPNPEMDSMILWETVLGHLLLWGNAYLYKVMNPATGFTEELWPLVPSRTYVQRIRSTNAIVYVTTLDSGEIRYLVPDEVIHIRAFGTGDTGISPIGAARRAIGIGVSADEYAARFYQNDARPGGVLSTDKTMTDEQYKVFKARWSAGHQGMSNSHLVGILDNGLTWHDVGVPPGDSQFIEQRKWQAQEICRIYRVPPHKVGMQDAGSVSYASVEQFNLDFVIDSIRPWATRLEKSIQRGMFSSEPDRLRKIYPQFQLNGLLRGDMVARSSFYAKGIEAGWLLKNEVRELEDLPFIAGLDDKPDHIAIDPKKIANQFAGLMPTPSNGNTPAD